MPNWRSDDRRGIGGALFVLVGKVGVGVAVRESKIGSGRCSTAAAGCAAEDGLSAFLGDPYRALTGDLPLGGVAERTVARVDDLSRNVVGNLSWSRICIVFCGVIGAGCSAHVHDPSAASTGDLPCAEDGELEPVGKARWPASMRPRFSRSAKTSAYEYLLGIVL